MIVNEQIVVNALLVGFDLGGTFVFALSGAVAGIKHRLDLFGVLVLSFAAGNSGGIARDVMIGAHPPAAISDWRYIAVSMLAGLITFYWYQVILAYCAQVSDVRLRGLRIMANGASVRIDPSKREKSRAKWMPALVRFSVRIPPGKFFLRRAKRPRHRADCFSVLL